MENDFFVDALVCIEQREFFGVVAPQKVSRGKQLYTRHLELGAGDRTLVTHSPVLGQMIGRHLGLFEQWCYEPIGHTAVLNTFADGIDTRVVGL